MGMKVRTKIFLRERRMSENKKKYLRLGSECKTERELKET